MHPFFWSRTAAMVAMFTAASISENMLIDASTTFDTNTDDAARSGVVGTGDRVEPSAASWIRRFQPRLNAMEFGAYGGAWLLFRWHELYGEDTGRFGDGHQDLAGVADTVERAPLHFLALEVEGGASLTRTAPDARTAILHLRGGIMGQLGHWSVVPFALIGAEALGVSRNSEALGRGVNAALCFGCGVEIKTSDTRTAE